MALRHVQEGKGSLERDTEPLKSVQEGKGSLKSGHRAGESGRREGSVECNPGTWLVSCVGMWSSGPRDR